MNKHTITVPNDFVEFVKTLSKDELAKALRDLTFAKEDNPYLVVVLDEIKRRQ